MVTNVLNIDRLDVQLIGLLTRDSRIGIVELSETLGVARNTAQARLRRLTDAGLLKGFTPQIDLNRVGVGVEAFAALTLEQGRLDDVVDALSEMAQVLEIHATTGSEDLLVRLACTDLAKLQDVIQRVIAIQGVRQSNTSVVLTTPLQYRVQPLLEHLTVDAGFGRSTPPATAPRHEVRHLNAKFSYGPEN
jgi:DNA-binding Lrp family transcriptional regulator